MEKKTYLMQDTIRGFYKIGRSKDPVFREKTLQAEVPSIKLVHTINKDMECTLHQKFKEKRMRGEWFNLNQQDVDYIKSIKVHKAYHLLHKCNCGWYEDKQYVYGVIIDFLKAHLEDNNKTIDNIDSSTYFISKTEYLCLKDISEGIDAPDVNQNKIKKLTDLLEIRLIKNERVLYRIEA